MFPLELLQTYCDMLHFWANPRHWDPNKIDAAVQDALAEQALQEFLRRFQCFFYGFGNMPQGYGVCPKINGSPKKIQNWMLFQGNMMIKYDAPLDFRCTPFLDKQWQIHSADSISSFHASRLPGDCQTSHARPLDGHPDQRRPREDMETLKTKETHEGFERPCFSKSFSVSRSPCLWSCAIKTTSSSDHSYSQKQNKRSSSAKIFRQSKNWCPAEPEKNWLCYVEVDVTVVTSSLTCPPLLRRPERPTAGRGLGKGEKNHGESNETGTDVNKKWMENRNWTNHGRLDNWWTHDGW